MPILRHPLVSEWARSHDDEMTQNEASPEGTSAKKVIGEYLVVLSLLMSSVSIINIVNRPTNQP